MNMVASKENTLYLPIKQVYFNDIINGVKKKEFREIKETTYKKYLQCMDGKLCCDEKLITCKYFNHYIDDYNNGVYPFIPTPYKYLNLAVGYAKERDTAIVEIVDITFEPQIIRSDKYAFWLIVYHLGRIVEIHRA